MRKLIVGLGALAVIATAAFAQDDPVATRKALMKANGAALGQLNRIVKGEQPFDAAAVQAALQKLSDDAVAFDPATLFPAGSDQGDTKASPKIWEDAAGFQAAVDKFRTDTAAALAANPQDAAALQTQFGAVAANCGACHQAYRL